MQLRSHFVHYRTAASFNSLFEMPSPCRGSTTYMRGTSFNSLFEMHLNIDPTETLAVVAYRCGAGSTCAVLNPIGEYQLLSYVVTATMAPRWYVIHVPRPGLLYAGVSFRIGPPGSGDGGKVSAASYILCGKTYQHAYYALPGTYNITPLPLPLYFVDPEKCVEYRIAASAGSVVNITALSILHLRCARLRPIAPIAVTRDFQYSI